MTKHTIHFLSLFLVALFLLSGCSHESANQNAQSDREIFQLDTRTAKIFFYASYNNADDKPFLSETFRLRVDGSYIGDIKADEFLTTRITPGHHAIDADEIDWGGNVANHSHFIVWINDKESYYVTEHLGASSKPILSKTDIGLGAQDIAARKAR